MATAFPTTQLAIYALAITRPSWASAAGVIAGVTPRQSGLSTILVVSPPADLGPPPSCSLRLQYVLGVQLAICRPASASVIKSLAMPAMVLGVSPHQLRHPTTRQSSPRTSLRTTCAPRIRGPLRRRHDAPHHSATPRPRRHVRRRRDLGTHGRRDHHRASSASYGVGGTLWNAIIRAANPRPSCR